MHVFLVDAVNVFCQCVFCWCEMTDCLSCMAAAWDDWLGSARDTERGGSLCKRCSEAFGAHLFTVSHGVGSPEDSRCLHWWEVLEQLGLLSIQKGLTILPRPPFHHHKILSRFSIFSAEGNLPDDQITLKLCKLSVFCQLNHESILSWSKNMRTRQSRIWLHLCTALLLSLLFLYIEICGRNSSWAPYVFNSCHFQMKISGESNDLALEAQERAPKYWKTWLQNVSRMSRMLRMLKNSCWENCDIISETEACPSLL